MDQNTVTGKVKNIFKKIYLKTKENTSLNRKRRSLEENGKLRYINEISQLTRNINKISLKEFWQLYVTGKDAPHYRIPYKGYFMSKLPCDMFIYPDIIYQMKPEVIIEIGTQRGSSAIYLADLLQSTNGKVLTVDINSPGDSMLKEFEKYGITFIHGNVNDDKTVKQILNFCNGKNCLVIDDGSHNQDDVYSAFKALNHLIPKNGLYVIEDGMTNAIVLPKEKDLQPNIGIDQILKDYSNFKLYRNYDIYIFSTVYKGIIQRIE